MATLWKSKADTFLTSLGVPRASGIVTFFAAGTSTPQFAYAEDALSTSFTSLTLDAVGRPQVNVYLDALDYKIIVSNSDLTDSKTIDVVHGANDPTDSTEVDFIQAGTGAVTRTSQSKLRERVTPFDFGAVGDGATDDYAAFQAAINYCQDNLKTLDITTQGPSLVYLLGTTLSVTKPFPIIGDGRYTVTLLGDGIGAGNYVLDVDGTSFGTFEHAEIGGFTLYGDGVCNLMRIKNVSSSRFFNIGHRNGAKGIVYTGTRCFSNVFDRIATINTMTGVAISMETHTGGGQHEFRACSLGGTLGFSLATDTVTDGVAFYNTNFEQCTSNSVYVGGTVYGLSFLGCRTEGGDVVDFQINPATGKTVAGLVISGCSFNATDAGGLDRISLGGAGGKVRGFSITGNTVDHSTNSFAGKLVNLNGDGESGVIEGNYLNGAIVSCAPVNAYRTGVHVANNEGNDGKFRPELAIGSATYDPASLNDGAGATTTVAVTGAALGDFVREVSFSLDLQGITLSAYVSAADTVAVRFQNESGGTLDLASGTIRVRVVKAS